VVTARDLLGWAISQGVFTQQGVRQGEFNRPAVVGIDGPWTDILLALITAAGEGLADPSSGIARDGSLDGFVEYVEGRCLVNFVRTFSLTTEQAAAVMSLAKDVRLFFDGAISIDSSGLDGPIRGDVYYQCGFDYRIDVPKWAASRAT
jgi:hypothetical protein